MGPFVHRELTTRWAIDAGISPEDAAVIGHADAELDRKKWTKPWCHFRLFGAGIIALFLARRAARRHDPILLGYALHAAQDAAGHGLILPFMHTRELDVWESAASEIQAKIEQITLRYLAAFAQNR